MKTVLERWSERTGTDRFVSIQADGSKPVAIAAARPVAGWYAKYKEGLFAYWLSGERQFVRWRDHTIELNTGTEIVWESRVFGRRFTVRKQGKMILEATYHTLLRNLGDAFDDWWGLVNDLPSFVHSGHSAGSLATQLSEWNAKSDAQQGVPRDGPASRARA